MAFPLDLINIGNAPNDGLGDDLRTAFQKLNELIAAAPYGGVIETGSNVNGQYVRLADGTQIAWANVVTDAMNAALGSLYRSSYIVGVPWPAAFAATPVTMAAAISNSSNNPRWYGQGTERGTATQTPSGWAVTFASTSDTATIYYLGFGRWK